MPSLPLTSIAHPVRWTECLDVDWMQRHANFAPLVGVLPGEGIGPRSSALHSLCLMRCRSAQMLPLRFAKGAASAVRPSSDLAYPSPQM